VVCLPLLHVQRIAIDTAVARLAVLQLAIAHPMVLYNTGGQKVSLVRAGAYTPELCEECRLSAKQQDEEARSVFTVSILRSF
jgi:hypothetical protein